MDARRVNPESDWRVLGKEGGNVKESAVHLERSS